MTLNDIRNEGFTFWNTVSLVTDVASLLLPVIPAGASHAIRAVKYANKAVNAADTAADTVRATEKIRTFFHATDVMGASSILENGIDLTKGRLNLDFNPAGKKGFYVTEILDQAKDWAKKFGDDARILQFDVPENQLHELSGKIFESGDDEWLEFSLSGRNGTLMHDFDYVEGPYLAKSTNQSKGHQLAIFTQKAVRIFNNSSVNIMR